MKITLYTTPTCTHCKALKQRLTDNNISFELFTVGENITRDAVFDKFPTAKQVPIVVIDDVWIHDYHGTINQIIEDHNQPLTFDGCSV